MFDDKRPSSNELIKDLRKIALLTETGMDCLNKIETNGIQNEYVIQ